MPLGVLYTISHVASLGKLADLTSVIFVYKVCAYLPALGILTALLPTLHHQKHPKPL